MNISDLTTVTGLVQQRQVILDLMAKLDSGEQIKLTIGETEVPIERPELVEAARYQLTVHFKGELEKVEQALGELNVTLDNET